MSRQVFVVNAKEEFDYTDAKKYGSLVYLSKGTVNIYKPNGLADSIAEAMKTYKSGDYLLLAGNCLPIFLTTLLAIKQLPEGSTINLLIYDLKYKRYVVHTFNVDANKFAEKPELPRTQPLH